MPRPGQRIKVSDSDLQKIIENASLPSGTRLTTYQLATQLGVSRLTIRRHLYKAGLHQSTALSIIGYSRPQDLWTRPCMLCGSVKPRPRWQYLCTPCTRKNITPAFD